MIFSVIGKDVVFELFDVAQRKGGVGERVLFVR